MSPKENFCKKEVSAWYRCSAPATGMACKGYLKNQQWGICEYLFEGGCLNTKMNADEEERWIKFQK